MFSTYPWFTQWPGALLSAGALVVTVVVIAQVATIVQVLLRGSRRQTSALAWILLVIVLPVGGILLFLLLGEVRLGRSRVRRHREIAGRLDELLAESWEEAREPSLNPEARGISLLACAVGGTRARAGNRLELIRDSAQTIDRMVEDIAAARDHCHLLTYIYLDDGSGLKMADALVAAAERGVRCRVLVDAVGSKGFCGSSLRRRLGDAGVEVVEALPVGILRRGLRRIDVRNHRKLLVVDGRTAYVGSQNIAEASFAPKPDYAPWVDVTVRVEGPAVRDLQQLFAEDWVLDTGDSLDALLTGEGAHRPEPIEGGVPVQIMGTGPNSDNDAMIQLIQATIHATQRELVMTTPYFVPDEGTLTALKASARRGVRTVLVVPERNDSPLVGAASRSFYDELLAAGVEIHEYRKGLLHSKTITTDREYAVVSTANMDRRSFEINFELAMVVYDEAFTEELRQLQARYVCDSKPVDPEVWMARPWPRRLVENTAGMLSSLL